MRLWHQLLIPYLDDKRLLNQHCTCCALRGNGWGKKHSIVDYVFAYNVSHLFEYHDVVMMEMFKRGYEVKDHYWYDNTFCGRKLTFLAIKDVDSYKYHPGDPLIFKEHNNEYLRECLLTLKAKGVELVNVSIDEALIQLDLYETVNFDVLKLS